MMDKPINIYEAKTQLSALVARAAAGEEIVICRAGQPQAKLVPVTKKRAKKAEKPWAHSYGMMKGKFDHLTEKDFQTSPELTKLMYGED